MLAKHVEKHTDTPLLQFALNTLQASSAMSSLGEQSLFLVHNLSQGLMMFTNNSLDFSLGNKGSWQLLQPVFPLQHGPTS